MPKKTSKRNAKKTAFPNIRKIAEAARPFEEWGDGAMTVSVPDDLTEKILQRAISEGLTSGMCVRTFALRREFRTLRTRARTFVSELGAAAAVNAALFRASGTYAYLNDLRPPLGDQLGACETGVGEGQIAA